MWCILQREISSYGDWEHVQSHQSNYEKYFKNKDFSGKQPRLVTFVCIQDYHRQYMGFDAVTLKDEWGRSCEKIVEKLDLTWEAFLKEGWDHEPVPWDKDNQKRKRRKNYDQYYAIWFDDGDELLDWLHQTGNEFEGFYEHIIDQRVGVIEL